MKEMCFFCNRCRNIIRDDKSVVFCSVDHKKKITVFDDVCKYFSPSSERDEYETLIARRYNELP